MDTTTCTMYVHMYMYQCDRLHLSKDGGCSIVLIVSEGDSDPGAVGISTPCSDSSASCCNCCSGAVVGCSVSVGLAATLWLQACCCACTIDTNLVIPDPVQHVQYMCMYVHTCACTYIHVHVRTYMYIVHTMYMYMSVSCFMLSRIHLQYYPRTVY